ncbi:hypothetical protein FQN50_003954 [Emmonsiellopsis sp. PD_5]|nr:hypothetical protein FQN50_003954 [Emmonsiellopsis sp. PD_5]
MKILEPQSATLTNIEVLAHFTQNPPRRPPAPPSGSRARTFVPSPDLRDHCTVVKEFHNYVTRLSPHLLEYPSFNPPDTTTTTTTSPSLSAPEPTPLDSALRELISHLAPYQLTKAEVLMIINLGVGLDSPNTTSEPGEEEGVNGNNVNGNGEDVEMGDGGDGDGEEGAAGIDEEADYGALALLDTVIEDREERLSEEDVGGILRVVRGALGRGKGRGKGDRGEGEGEGEGEEAG